jgi:hypothetical protein
MHSQGSFPTRRSILRGALLGLLVLFAFAFALRAAEPITVSDSNSFVALHGKAVSNANPSDISFTPSPEVVLPEDFGAALEDSDDLLRADVQQRTGGPDRTMIEPKVSTRSAPASHSSISPPLLV